MSFSEVSTCFRSRMVNVDGIDFSVPMSLEEQDLYYRAPLDLFLQQGLLDKVAFIHVKYGRVRSLAQMVAKQ